jgi:hypothetical protein
MSSGTTLFTANQNSTISTGTRIICNSVNSLMSMLSINDRPLFKKNREIMATIGGSSNNINLGGIVSLTV